MYNYTAPKVVRVPVPVIGAQPMNREHQIFLMTQSLEYPTLIELSTHEYLEHQMLKWLVLGGA